MISHYLDPGYTLLHISWSLCCEFFVIGRQRHEFSRVCCSS